MNSLDFFPVGGGSINETYRVQLNRQQYYFLKLNSAIPYSDFFEKEKQGLAFLRQKSILRVPDVIENIKGDMTQLLLMEWIDAGEKTKNFWASFGKKLAMLHQVSDNMFGFETDNFIGALPQSNKPYQSWSDFYVQCRLMPQVIKGVEKNLLDKIHLRSFETLYRKLNSIFNEEKPSLLHGDLWSGNYMCDKNEQPVLIDPAVYFGHRSIDLGMTTLFGGFHNIFYDAYHHHYPFPENYRDQWEVSNLYPLLIHLNLFGSSYLPGINAILKKYT
ncbi:MAG: fructosamine kinase family protein [Bacteroidia bacterium]|nr:fructosamine kinase family protein [Bacteroidia bacterium]